MHCSTAPIYRTPQRPPLLSHSPQPRLAKLRPAWLGPTHLDSQAEKIRLSAAKDFNLVKTAQKWCRIAQDGSYKGPHTAKEES